MASNHLVKYQPSSIDQARAELDWLSDEDVAFIESKDPAAAVGLSLLCGGGGHFYTGDHLKGIGLTGAAVAAIVLGPVLLPLPLALLPFIALVATSAIRARDKAKKINKFVLAKREEENRGAAHPGAYRLLAAMSRVDARAVREAAAVAHAGALPGLVAIPATQPSHQSVPQTPSRHPDLIDKLRKLITLRSANVISDLEHKERKIDLLADVASGLDRDQLDELLFDLLPLLQQGTVTDEDIEFIKSLAK